MSFQSFTQNNIFFFSIAMPSFAPETLNRGGEKVQERNMMKRSKKEVVITDVFTIKFHNFCCFCLIGQKF